MAKRLNDLSSHLAKNLSSLRQKRGISQAQLSRISGIPRSTLTHMESGEGNPSLHTLSKVSASLQVSIEELLNRPRASCKHIRSADIPKQKRSQGLVTVYKLLPDAIPGMEIDRMELKPGARMGGIPHVAHTKEYLVCIKGAVQVAVSGDRFDLDEGDVLAFPGDQAHSYFNPGKTSAICMSVVVLAPVGV